MWLIYQQSSPEQHTPTVHEQSKYQQKQARLLSSDAVLMTIYHMQYSANSE